MIIFLHIVSHEFWRSLSSQKISPWPIAILYNKYYYLYNKYYFLYTKYILIIFVKGERYDSMKKIAIANQKGGVAKTTTTYNLATVKAMSGKRVLMIDLDPQASLTISCGMNPDAEDFLEKNVCNLFDGKTDPAECAYQVENSGIETLYIIPSNLDLAVTETELVVKSRNSDVQLRKAVQKLESYFDYIFIDCPPQLGKLLTNALTACDEVIIPVKTDYLSYRGLNALLNTIDDIQHGDGDRSLNPDLTLDGCVATMYEKMVNDQQDVLELLQKKLPVLGVVKKSSTVYKNIIDGKPVVLAQKGTDVAKSYIEIAMKI